jgi:Helix-turn-helix domain
MTVITTSRNELTRLRVLIDIGDGRLSVEVATGLIGVGRRQIYRLLDAFRVHGADGLISGKVSRPESGHWFRLPVCCLTEIDGRPRIRLRAAGYLRT